jgi:hypothetical protein
VRFKISTKGKFKIYRLKSNALVNQRPQEEDQSAQKDNNTLTENDPALGNEISKPRMDTINFDKFVETIILNCPELKEEDREVLYFLAEKRGTVFEGEIRTKFKLPKTSVWRLVKRLERLELIEVTKIGGQNLLKLKFP